MATDEGARAACSPGSRWPSSSSWGWRSGWRRRSPAAPPPVPDVTPDRVDAGPALTGYAAPARPLRAGDWLTLWRSDWLWLTSPSCRGALRRRRGPAAPPGRPLAGAAARSAGCSAGWSSSGRPAAPRASTAGCSFSVHMVMHMTIAMVAPMLLVLAAPIILALRALPARPDKTLGPRELLLGLVHSRLLTALATRSWPPRCSSSASSIFYYSPLFELALRTHTGHVLMVIALPAHRLPVRLGAGRRRPRAAEVVAVAPAARSCSRPCRSTRSSGWP